MYHHHLNKACIIIIQITIIQISFHHWIFRQLTVSYVAVRLSKKYLKRRMEAEA